MIARSTCRVAALAALLLPVLAPQRVGAQDRSQSRSMVLSKQGVVASESVLASQVGASILERGGNAIDAAVAMNAMMGLVAPMNDGIGGDLFAIVYEAKTGKLYGLNASGWAPKGLTVAHLRAKGSAAPLRPGRPIALAPAAWSPMDEGRPLGGTGPALVPVSTGPYLRTTRLEPL